MASRGKSNWIVLVSQSDGAEEESLYGVYTETQAKAVVDRIKRHEIARQKAEDEDPDDLRLVVIARELLRWAPDPIEKGILRPNCPYCMKKMKVWSSQYEDKTYGNCSCSKARDGEFLLEVRDGVYVISE
jgi:hypothetical protein